MIKLQCPNCESDNIFFLDVEIGGVVRFMCEQCGKIFTFEDTHWEQEEE